MASAKSIRNESYLEDSSCISLRDQLYENPDMTSNTDSELLRLLAHLREYCQVQSLNENYDDAAKASDLAELVRINMQSRAGSGTGTYDHLTSSSEEFEANWAEHFRQFEERMEQKRDNLMARHQWEMEEFEREWSEEMPRKYRKPSAALLQMKAMERSMSISGQYDRAKALHNEAELLAAREAEILQSNLIRDYRLAKEAKVRRQRWEEEKFEHDVDQTRTCMEANKKRELDQRANRDVVVEEKKAESMKSNREMSGKIKSGYGSSVAATVQGRTRYMSNMLPPLFAPNDPKFV
jgi:hypothetical protein